MTGENSLFPGHPLVLAISHPWEIEFYTWDFSGPKNSHPFRSAKEMGLRPLRLVFNLPV
jgi:hypothetical protein